MTKGEQTVLVVFRLFKIFFKIVVLGFLLVGVLGYTFFKTLLESNDLAPQ